MYFDELISLVISRNFAVIKKTREDELNRLALSYKKGLGTKEELRNKFNEFLLVGSNDKEIYKLINTFGFYKMPYEASTLFINDYKKRENNKTINGKWDKYLKIDYNQIDFLSSKETKRIELSASEIIELVESILVPIDAFRTIPSNIPTPKINHVHAYSNCDVYTVRFNNVDDDGLLSDDNPIGKKFNITRDDGIKAHFEVVEYRPEGTVYKYRNNNYTENQNHYICIGTIDEYFFSNTKPPKNNIEFYVSNDKKTIDYIIVKSFRSSNKISFSIDFPKWKRYLDFCKERTEILDSEINAMWNNLIEKTYDII